MNMPTRTCFVCKKPFTQREVQLYGFGDSCAVCTYQKALTQENTVKCTFWADHYNEADIPLRYWTIIESPISERASARANKAVAEQKTLYLCGDVETGKTLTLSIYAMQLIRFGVTVKFARLSNLANTLRNDPAVQASTYKKFCGCDHLILDDLGTQYDGTGWFTGWLDAIVDHRYSNLKATSASTNVPELINSRISRRLTELCENIKVQ